MKFRVINYVISENGGQNPQKTAEIYDFGGIFSEGPSHHGSIGVKFINCSYNQKTIIKVYFNFGIFINFETNFEKL